jgi:hypothetical protein
MSVYVDPMRKTQKSIKWPFGRGCHLLADSVNELTMFARMLGLKDTWLQTADVPHYDLTAGKRALAVRMGAVDLDVRGAVHKAEEWRERKVDERKRTD